MAAYGGYVATQPVDFGAMASDFTGKAIAIQEAQKQREEKKQLLQQQYAEKQAEKEAEIQKEQFKNIEQQTTDALKIINAENPITPSPTINDILSKSVSLGADTAFLLERDQKADPANALTFRSQRQNLTQDISNLKNATSEYAKGADVLMKAMPDQSKQGQFLASVYLNNGDLQGMDVAITPDRRLGFYKKDPQTGEAIPGTGFSPDMFSKYNLYADPKRDYNKILDDFKIGTFDVIEKSGPRTQTKTTSEKLNPLYGDAKKSFIKGLTGSDADVARILTDLGGYGMYANELNQVPGESGKSVMYRYSPKGAYLPVIDDKMRAEAAAILDKGLEARIKEAKQETKDADITVNAGGGSGIDKFIQREDIKEAKKMKPLLIKSKIANDFFYGNRLGEMKAAARSNGIGNPTITEKDNYKILYGVPKGKTKATEIARFNTADEAYAYLTGKSNVVEAAAEYQLAKDYATENDLNIQPASKETLTFDMKAARGMAPGKSDEEIKAIIIKQNPGKRLLWKN
jgi:hypothetical protein